MITFTLLINNQSSMFRFLIITIFLFIQVSVSGQGIDSMMNVYRDNFPQEKIHVHFDKAYYIPGETIWFKGYIMSGINLSGISKNFYAELVNQQGVVIQKIVAPVLDASAASSFTIPSNYASELLHFRAYTTWMLNFDTTFLFTRNIRVVVPSAAAKNTPVENISNLQFFPEGGDLVDEVETELAFKANDSYGLPVKVKGFIKSQDGKKVTDFESKHNGMGVISFSPAKGETYTAVWKDSTNKEKTTPLPKSKSVGLVLNAKHATNSVTFMVRRTDGNDAFKQVHLVAHMDQQMVYKARINLSENFLSSGRIPVDQLPSGILQLTLFNSNWQPMAERIVFVNNNDYMFDAYSRTLSKSLDKRGKNTVEIEIPDTLLSNMSLAITDAAANVQSENDDNIYSRLLLTADLKGYVHNPGYYFSSFADSVAQQLDLVMLTHGWRRFNWDDLAKGKLPVIKHLNEDYISLKGSVVGVDPSKMSKDNLLNFIIQLKDSSKQFLSLAVDGGKFESSGMVFYDTARIYYQLNKDRRMADKLIVKVENGLWKGYSLIRLPEDLNQGFAPLERSIVEKSRNLFAQNVRLESDRTKKAKMLEEVVVRAKARSASQKMEDTYTSGLFKGGDGFNFDLTNDISAVSSMSLFNYLQGRVPGLMISNAMSGEPTLSWRGGTPALFLNEIPTDAQNLSSMPMTDIAYVKVIRPPFMGAAGGGSGGAIAVYTKRGGESQSNDFVGLNKFTIAGYTPIKEFYSPNYAEKNNPQHDLDDIRTTLYWEPFIFLDKDRKKVAVSFYNNDVSKKLRVVIEGVNDAGKLTHVESVIE